MWDVITWETRFEKSEVLNDFINDISKWDYRDFSSRKYQIWLSEPNMVVLKNGLDDMQKCSWPCIICFHKVSKTKKPRKAFKHAMEEWELIDVG